MPDQITDEEIKEYAPIQDGEPSEEEKKYYSEVDPEETGGKKNYTALKQIPEVAVVEETWWDNQTYRTILAVFITIVFTTVIACLVFLLPCVEDQEFLMSTAEPLTTLIMDMTETITV